MFIGILVCTIVVYLFWWFRRPTRFPPGPRGVPILGAIPFLSRHPERKFHQWSKVYGPILSVRVGSKEWVVLNSYDAVTEVMLRNGKKFSARPPNYTLDKILSPSKRGLVFLSGKEWEIKRRFGEATFRSFGVGRNSFEGHVQVEAEKLVHAMKESKNFSPESRDTISKAVANVISRFIFGRRFDYSDKTFLERTHKTISHPRDGVVFNLAILMPWTTILPPVRTVLRRVKAQGQKASRSYIEEMKIHEENFNSACRRDFIDSFLAEKHREKKENGQNLHFTDDHLRIYIMDLFNAGLETSSNTISWCILGALHYPHFQKEIRSEIQSVIKNDKPSFGHRNSMPFTQAYILEVHRFCTLAPLGIPHCATEDVSVWGYTIPKGTQVMANLWSVHNDDKTFQNPHEFSPRRFIDENGNFVKPKFVIPFLVGPRRCLGEQLAHMEVFIFLTSILQKFCIERDCSDPLPPMNDGVAGITNSPKPFKAIYVPLE